MSVTLKSAVFFENDLGKTNHQKYGVSSRDPEKKKQLPVIVVQNGCKSYKKGVPVLEDLNMTVNRGTIYALIGASGCGKSTALSCILGLTKLTTGNAWVFGKTPRERESGVPGTAVGYMPQDYSLYKEYTIEETFQYFGRLNGLDSYKITTAMAFYSDLLQLPDISRYIHSLSGGQTRRVSLSIALFHNPRILILDEPTVGLDPVLRESIWTHLHYLTKTKGNTVIITSHYLEEARHSDMIGIMRCGHLIAEQSPAALLQEYNTYSLQTAVLQVCLRNDGETPTRNIKFNQNGKERNISMSDVQLSQLGTPPPMDLLFPSEKNAKFSSTLRRSWAFTGKEFSVTIRNIPMLVMSILIPTLTMLATLIAIGNNPSHVNFGVVNEELGNLTCGDVSFVWVGECEASYLSCKFLSHVKPNEFVMNYYRTTEEAAQAVKLGYTLGYIHFQADFSSNFFDRATTGLQADLDIMNKSDIIIKMDQSNEIVFQHVNHAWYKVFQKFIKGILADCGLDSRLGDYSLQYKTPIFGHEDISFRDFVIPSYIIGAMFLWPVITTGIRYVSEKRQGTLQRSVIAGIQLWEVFLGYAVIEAGIGILRAIIFFAMTQYIFQLENFGSLLPQLILGVLAVYMGTAGGIMVGSLCSEEIQVALLSMALFLPNSFLTSQVWPLESMRPVMFQKICYYLPGTLACEAMRSMWNRGWGILHPNVWPGFASVVAYAIFFLVIAMLIFKLRFHK